MEKRILYVLQGIGMGGVSSVILNYFRMLDDEVKADFVVIVPYEHIPTELRNDLTSKGCKIFHVTPFVKNMRKYRDEVQQIIKSGNYDIVHDNNKYFAFLSLQPAKKYGINNRICHVHNTIAANEKGLTHRLFIKITSKLSVRYATTLLACSREAGQSMFGSHNFTVLNNAIDSDTFKFNEERRAYWRAQLNIENAYAMIMVARKEVLKRYDFAFHVFHELCKLRNEAVFLVVGMNEEELSGRDKEAYNGLPDEEKKRIFLLGRRMDANELLSAADVFILTSEHEGFGIAIVEAQANGLPCCVSDAIPRSTDCTGLVDYLPTAQQAELWAETINEKSAVERSKYADIIENGDFSINHNKKQLESIYGVR